MRDVILSLISALALPVVGLITGRVVGDFFVRGDALGWAGAGVGLLVYVLALAASYSHLRHYYSSFEAEGVRAAWALAVAIEVATFYMSFAYVVIRSPWAYWGSFLGAFVVFWGNFSSMLEARKEKVKAQLLPRQGNTELLPRQGNTERPEALYEEEEEVHRRRRRIRARASGLRPTPVAQPSAVVDETPVDGASLSEEHQEDASPSGEHRVASPSGEHREVQALPYPSAPQFSSNEEEAVVPLGEVEQAILTLAQEGPVGPSKVARALGIAKSSALGYLRKLERAGFLVKEADGYRGA